MGQPQVTPSDGNSEKTACKGWLLHVDHNRVPSPLSKSTDLDPCQNVGHELGDALTNLPRKIPVGLARLATAACLGSAPIAN